MIGRGIAEAFVLEGAKESDFVNWAVLAVDGGGWVFKERGICKQKM